MLQTVRRHNFTCARRAVLCGLLILSLFVPVARSQTPAPDFLKVVGFIFGTFHVRTSNGSSVTAQGPLGTVFFLLMRDDRGGPDFGFVYAVTAKHVLRDTDGKFLRSVQIRLNLRVPEGDKGYDFLTVPVSDEAGNLLWFHDLNDQGDEAVAFPILPDQNRFDFKAFPATQLVDDDLIQKQQVGPGDSLFFVGLLPQYYGRNKNFPVVRKGSIALLSNEELPTPVGPQRGYIAEVASWPGNSGSPVFLNLSGFRGSSMIVGGAPSLLGIMISQYNNSRTADVVDNSAVAIADPSSIGLAFIQPATSIKKILESPMAQQLRDADIKARNHAK